MQLSIQNTVGKLKQNQIRNITMNKLKLISLYFLFQFLTFEIMAQNNVSNHDTICYFTTAQGEIICLMSNIKTKLLIFNMKSPNNKPETSVQSTVKDTIFTYSYYLRGGAAANEGLELNYVYFSYKNKKYIIYEISYYEDQDVQFGIRIIDSKTNALIEKKATKGQIKGTLTGLRENNAIKHGEEIFD